MSSFHCILFFRDCIKDDGHHNRLGLVKKDILSAPVLKCSFTQMWVVMFLFVTSQLALHTDKITGQQKYLGPA